MIRKNLVGAGFRMKRRERQIPARVKYEREGERLCRFRCWIRVRSTRSLRERLWSGLLRGERVMENAIDAGPRRSPWRSVRAASGYPDHGQWMRDQKGRASVSVLRHSTSKIRTAEDLLTVSSLGFRGEALSSIAAVSQVELITKTSGSLTGSRYRIEGGEEKGLEEIGAPDGTTFYLQEPLFQHTCQTEIF